MDMFLALTSDDEDNIMSAMLAKRLGANRVLSLINRRAYADMMQGSTIDIAISPSQTVIGELLAHLRRGDVAAVHSLRRGAAEALEGVARGDIKTSKLVGRRVEEIRLPQGARFGAIVRGEGADAEVLMPHHDTVIEDGDHDLRPRKAISGFTAADHLKTMAEAVSAWSRRIIAPTPSP